MTVQCCSLVADDSGFRRARHNDPACVHIVKYTRGDARSYTEVGAIASTPSRNPPTSSTQISGSSTWVRWLVPATSSQRAPGMRRWICSTMCGVASSNSPDRSSVGTSISRQAIGDVPVEQAADRVELARPVHRVVDGRVRGHHRERPVHEVRPHLEAADVPLVEDLRRRLVLGRVGRAVGLVLRQRRLHVLGQVEPEAVRLGDPQAHAGRRVADGDAAQARRVLERVQHGEHAAPGLPDHVVGGADAELGDERVQLALEQLGRPELGGRVGQVLGVAVSELVVEDARASRVRERRHRLEVVVGRARPPVAEDRGRRPVRRDLTDHAVPGAVSLPLEERSRCSFHAPTFVRLIVAR